MKNEYSAGIITFIDRMENDKLKRFYLLLHYVNGYWDFPKGKLEKNETKLEAAHRELKEETNLTAKIIPGFEQVISYMFKDNKNILTYKEVTYFLGQASSDDVILSSEHLYYKWLPFADAVKELTYSNSKQLLKMANQFLVKT